MRINRDDSIAGTANVAVMWIEFFNTSGELIGGEGGVIADAATANNTWL